jgi:hypothetical protein
MAGWYSYPESPGFHPGLLGTVVGPLPQRTTNRREPRDCGWLRVQWRVFSHLTIRASRQRWSVGRGWRAGGPTPPSGGHGRPEVRPPGRPVNPRRSPRRPKAVGARDGLVFAPAPPADAAVRRPRPPGGAAARPSGEPLAFAATAQGCRGHGWAGFRAGASLRACFGLREARREGEPSQVEAHLGCASDLPRLSGPWMARQP